MAISTPARTGAGGGAVQRRPAAAVRAPGGSCTGAPPPPQTKTAHDQVTILPKKDGSIGGVVVRTDGVVVLLDKAYATALVEGPGMVTESTYDAELANQEFAEVLAALPGEPTKFLLYFLEGQDELTPESEEEIGKIFDELATRPAPEILVIGHTDAVGAGQYNDKLSLQRAERVREELVRRGIPEDSITVSGRGQVGAAGADCRRSGGAEEPAGRNQRQVSQVRRKSIRSAHRAVARPRAYRPARCPDRSTG